MNRNSNIISKLEEIATSTGISRLIKVHLAAKLLTKKIHEDSRAQRQTPRTQKQRDASDNLPDKPETFMQVCMDIVWSLSQHGIKKFFFVDGHGGNRPALSLIVNKIKYEVGLDAAWASFTSVAEDVVKRHAVSPITGHACESEISECLYPCPHVVKKESLEKGDIPPDVLESWRRIPVEQPKYWEEITKNGALGDATKASHEFGREAVETALDTLEEFLRNFIGE